MAPPPEQPPRQAADFSREDIEAIEDPQARLRALMKRLLDPGGCPWDRKQDHLSLKQYLIEEAYEVCEAIDRGDDREFCEELGDLALQIVFHAELAERRRAFRLEDVYAGICAKLLDRHPHVFGDVEAHDAETVLNNWERQKKQEKKDRAEASGERRQSILEGVPVSLPALQRAQRLQSKASKVGFDWEKIEDVEAKVREEVGEFLEEAREGNRPAMREEWGDLLFSLVNLGRFLDLDAEEALGHTCRKFTDRFHTIEAEAERDGRDLADMTLKEMDEIWNRSRKR